jgi:uncharacterized protein (TIGR02452 family)
MEDEEELITLQFLAHRIRKILKVATLNGHKNIILGAWGCGAYRNNPELIAQTFKDMLEDVPKEFEHVTFAVYDTRQPTVLFDTFKKVFGV